MILPSATILRLLAAWLVLATHSVKLSGNDGFEPVLRWTGSFEASHLGLAIFFVLSGHLVAGSASRCAGAMDFLSRRMRRIVPAWIACVVIVVFVLAPLLCSRPIVGYFSRDLVAILARIATGSAQWDLPGVFETHRFHSANGSVWTIPYEVLLYGVLGSAFFARGLRSHRRAFAASAWLAVVVVLATATDLGNHVEWRILGFRVAYLVPFASWFLGGWALQAWNPPRPLLVGTVLVGLPLWLLSWGSPWRPALEAVVLPPSVLLLASIRIGSRLRGIPDISYGYYLWGWPVQQTILHFHPEIPPFVFLVVASVTTLVPASLSWYVVERRFLSRRRTEPSGVAPIVH